jgi:two-component system NarL family sensor kinase
MLAIRYAFILIAALGTLYLVPVPSHTLYTFALLCYLALERAHYQWGKGIWDIPLLFAQFVWITYLSLTYGGLLFILFYASLFALTPDLREQPKRFLILLQGILLNVAVWSEPVPVLILANLADGIIVTSLYLLGNVTRKNEEIRQLYDSLRRHHYELDEARRRIVDYARKVEQIAQLEERNRISKDIHDEIGHKLIRVKMLMEAALRFLPADTNKGMELLYQVRDQLSDSMEMLRATVHRLKPDQAILKQYSLKSLIEGFAADSGVVVRYETIGQPVDLYPSVEVALYRNAQEAMTNAVRHGRATEVTVTVHYQPERIIMSISNNGVLPEREITKGLGLKGMEERMELLGGTVEVEWDERYCVRSILPVQRD